MHHPKAIIDPKAKLDNGVSIGPYCVIGPQVKIGSGTILESHVILKGNTKIGKNNHLFQFSTVGDGSPDKKYKGEPTRLVIGDENQKREGVTIHRGTIQEKGVTKIGNRNLFLAYSHVAHDCEIEDDVVLTNQAALAGAVLTPSTDPITMLLLTGAISGLFLGGIGLVAITDQFKEQIHPNPDQPSAAD